MKKFLLASGAMILAVAAMGAVPSSPAETQFLSTNGITVPDGLTSTQETAIHRLIKSGCTAGHHASYYGMPMDCAGDPVADTQTYVNLVNAQQLCAILGGCPPTA